MENEFVLKVGEVEETIIDYSKTVDELIAYFDEQTEQINSGERKEGNIELVMLGYAIDFVFFTKNATNIILDFEEEVIPVFDRILEAIYKKYCSQAPSQEEFSDMVKKATGFLCVVIWKNIGGGIIGSNIGIGVNVKGTNAFVMNRIARRLQNGSEDDIISFYHSIKEL